MIGDFPHHRGDDGRIWGLEPVVAQLDCWGDRFERMVLCGPVLPGPPPSGFAPYRTPGVEIVEVRRAGGNTPLAKLGLLPRIPGWAWRTRRVARSVDAVHLRCPCNVGLVAIASTWGAVRYRYAIYAGVWRSYEGEPRWFGVQRRLLASRRFGGPVSVYAAKDPQRPHLEPFFSPSFDRAAWAAAAERVAAFRAELPSRPAAGPWHFVTVGRLTRNKNHEAAIRAVAQLVARGVDAHLEVLGDGPLEAELRSLAHDLEIAERVRFRGMVDLATVNETFAASDLQILSTYQEGYGKVLLEGMVHGVVPLFSPSPAAPAISGGGSRALLIDPDDPASIADAAMSLMHDRDRWLAMVDDARAFTESCTLEAFGDAVHDVLLRGWGVDLPVRRAS